LMSISEKDLEELGVTKFGHRRLLTLGAQELRKLADRQAHDKVNEVEFTSPAPLSCTPLHATGPACSVQAPAACPSQTPTPEAMRRQDTCDLGSVPQRRSQEAQFTMKLREPSASEVPVIAETPPAPSFPAHVPLFQAPVPVVRSSSPVRSMRTSSPVRSVPTCPSSPCLVVRSSSPLRAQVAPTSPILASCAWPHMSRACPAASANAGPIRPPCVPQNNSAAPGATADACITATSPLLVTPASSVSLPCAGRSPGCAVRAFSRSPSPTQFQFNAATNAAPVPNTPCMHVTCTTYKLCPECVKKARELKTWSQT